jgi:hypothetical protein
LFDAVRKSLPPTVSDADISNTINSLLTTATLSTNASANLVLAHSQITETKKAMAELYTSQHLFHRSVYDSCLKSTAYSIPYTDTAKIVDKFISELFRLYGHEVAENILNYDNPAACGNPLDEDTMDTLLSKATADFEPASARTLGKVLRRVLLDPPSDYLPYFSALSTSYVCMQLLNSNPDVIKLQSDRMLDSIAVLDTDVLLTGIISGERRQSLAKELVRLCQKTGIKYFAFTDSIEEIVFRIKRSIQTYYDLGSPSTIPPDKKSLIHDIFLDVYFDQLAQGETASFHEFMQRYYEEVSPSEHIQKLLFDELKVECESINTHYIVQQEDKIERLQDIIEAARRHALSFKSSVLYYRDAKAMVVVEQQNREKIRAGTLGRWYLVSGDKHILKAYLTKKESFKTKPCVLPRHFIELLHQIPANITSPSSFGAILRSEAFMHGPGKNYISVIASMTKLGVKALDYSRERLLELLDEMERADFTTWLIELRKYDNLPEDLRDNLRDALETLFAESSSRNAVMEDLKRKELPPQ